MGGIFISYRRDDTAPYARILSESLAARFGREQIYRDLDVMKPGADFMKAVTEAIQACDAFLVLIGPDWLATRPDGSRRLDDPADLVRLEVATALSREGVLVVPLLIEGTPMPRPSELPAALAALSVRHAHKLADDGWTDDLRRLVEALEPVVRPAADLSSAQQWRKRMQKPMLAAIAVVALSGILTVLRLLPEPAPKPDVPPSTNTLAIESSGSTMPASPDDQYRQQVRVICQQDGERERASKAQAKRVTENLQSTGDFSGYSLAILEVLLTEVAEDRDSSGLLKALTPPGQLAEVHARTVASWRQLIDGQQSSIDALRRELSNGPTAAMQAYQAFDLSALRKHELEKDDGLQELAGRGCNLTP